MLLLICLINYAKIKFAGVHHKPHRQISLSHGSSTLVQPMRKRRARWRHYSSNKLQTGLAAALSSIKCPCWKSSHSGNVFVLLKSDLSWSSQLHPWADLSWYQQKCVAHKDGHKRREKCTDDWSVLWKDSYLKLDFIWTEAISITAQESKCLASEGSVGSTCWCAVTLKHNWILRVRDNLVSSAET